MVPQTLYLGDNSGNAHVRFEINGYVHPERAEPAGMDLLQCIVHAVAAPVDAAFELTIRVEEFASLGEYLAQINSGNGPPANFSFADGLLELSFAPSRRGPVLCAVRMKSIDIAHVRVEYLVTLEPEAISRSVAALAALQAAVE